MCPLCYLEQTVNRVDQSVPIYYFLFITDLL